ncbi:MAG: transcriptional repressor [Desulfobacteraceae bacterium]|nr:MAG: transcriptional repressor [Desulfobacteraceae bacterium]
MWNKEIRGLIRSNEIIVIDKGLKLRDKNKFRMTHQRMVILEEVKKDRSHPTVDDIFARVRKRMPKISLATIYRNLDILAGRGLIRKLEPGRPQMRFDGETHDHYHLTCMHCGRLEDSTIDSADQALTDLRHYLKNANESGIISHRLEFVGLCKKCRASKTSELKTEDNPQTNSISFKEE